MRSSLRSQIHSQETDRDYRSHSFNRTATKAAVVGYFETFLAMPDPHSERTDANRNGEIHKEIDPKKVPMGCIGSVLHVREWEAIPRSAVETMQTAKEELHA
jgi:hypothetical protein